jgi:hypothetical protein
MALSTREVWLTGALIALTAISTSLFLDNRANRAETSLKAAQVTAQAIAEQNKVIQQAASDKEAALEKQNAVLQVAVQTLTAEISAEEKQRSDNDAAIKNESIQQVQQDVDTKLGGSLTAPETALRADDQILTDYPVVLQELGSFKQSLADVSQQLTNAQAEFVTEKAAHTSDVQACNAKVGLLQTEISTSNTKHKKTVFKVAVIAYGLGVATGVTLHVFLPVP